MKAQRNFSTTTPVYVIKPLGLSGISHTSFVFVTSSIDNPGFVLKQINLKRNVKLENYNIKNFHNKIIQI